MAGKTSRVEKTPLIRSSRKTPKKNTIEDRSPTPCVREVVVNKKFTLQGRSSALSGALAQGWSSGPEERTPPWLAATAGQGDGMRRGAGPAAATYCMPGNEPAEALLGYPRVGTQYYRIK